MLSIIICTYNRCDSLKDVLNSLNSQVSFGSGRVEALVVDNNSNDRTREMVEETSRDFPIPLRYVFELRQGISLARNRGVEESQGDILVFADDDVILEKDWVINILDLCQRHHFAAAGGRVLPLYPPDTPDWVLSNRDILRGPVLCHDFGPEIKPYDKNMDPFVGANLIVLRTTFEEFGLFNTDIVRGQDTMGEDTELFLRLAKKGKCLIYCGSVCLKHKADPKRMNLKYLARWHMRAGCFYAIRHEDESQEELACWYGVPRYLFRRLFFSLLGFVPGLFNRRRFLITWNRMFINAGMIQQFRRIHIQKKNIYYDL